MIQYWTSYPMQWRLWELSFHLEEVWIKKLYFWLRELVCWFHVLCINCTSPHVGSAHCILFNFTDDPVTDHGLLNPTYLEALLWEGKRYQSLYLSPIGVDAAFKAPLASSAAWFPDWAYTTTKQLIIAFLQLLIWLRELVRSVVIEIRGKRGEQYEQVSNLN